MSQYKTMNFKSITLKDKTEFACNRLGEGIFIRMKDGIWQQQTGTGQTPIFKTAQQFSRYVHKNYRDLLGRKLPRMVSSSGW